MFSFYKSATQSLMEGEWAEDGPSAWFLIQLIFGSMFNVFMLITGIFGLASGGQLDNSFDWLNPIPNIYLYMTILSSILALTAICAAKTGCSHPYSHDEQRIFYPIYLWIYSLLSPVGLVFFIVTSVILFFCSIQDIVERGILYITNIKQKIKQRKMNKPKSAESAVWNKYDQFLKDGDR